VISWSSNQFIFEIISELTRALRLGKMVWGKILVTQQICKFSRSWNSAWKHPQTKSYGPYGLCYMIDTITLPAIFAGSHMRMLQWNPYTVWPVQILLYSCIVRLASLLLVALSFLLAKVWKSNGLLWFSLTHKTCEL